MEQYSDISNDVYIALYARSDSHVWWKDEYEWIVLILVRLYSWSRYGMTFLLWMGIYMYLYDGMYFSFRRRSQESRFRLRNSCYTVVYIPLLPSDDLIIIILVWHCQYIALIIALFNIQYLGYLSTRPYSYFLGKNLSTWFFFLYRLFLYSYYIFNSLVKNFGGLLVVCVVFAFLPEWISPFAMFFIIIFGSIRYLEYIFDD